MNKKTGALKRVGTPTVREEEPERTGPYQVCGRFHLDFAGVCRDYDISYVPDVVPRPLPPNLQEMKNLKAIAPKEAPEVKGKRGGGGGRLNKEAVPLSLVTSPVLVVSNGDDTFRTFVVKDNIDVCLPCVQVEQELADDDRTVNEVHIHDWKIDSAMMEVLRQCWTALPFLHTLRLRNCGLTPDTVTSLSSCVRRCAKLRTMVLDGNHLAGAPVSSLLEEGSPLRHLSLRFCGVTPSEVHRMALVLGGDGGGDCGGGNKVLLSLNLSHNLVGPEGAASLAEALKVNRTLLTLNLTSNEVGDGGAAALAQALSWFPVRGQLLSTRRKLLHVACEKEFQLSQARRLAEGPPLRRKLSLRSEAFHSTPASARGSLEKADKLFRPASCTPNPARSSLEKSEKTLKVPGKLRKRSQPSLNFPARTAKPAAAQGKSGPKSRLANAPPRPSTLVSKLLPSPTPVSTPKSRPHRFRHARDTDLPVWSPHPLLQNGIIHEDEVWLPGNPTLLSLNLSRNGISEKGLRALTRALEEQLEAISHHGKGLCRLVLSRNDFSPQCPSAQRLSRAMSLRDPTFKSPRVDLEKSSVSPCALPVSEVF